MAQAMQSKLETTKINLLAAEKFLQESLQIIQKEGLRVKSEFDETLEIHKNASVVLEKQLGELEETQQITQQNLASWEEAEKNLASQNSVTQSELTLLLQSAEQRLLQVTTAIMKFESETKKVQERNSALVDQIEIGLQRVIQQNLAC